jgi:protocatechuate 3,4-dioxygenase beta subunit
VNFGRVNTVVAEGEETPMTMHFPRESAKVHPPSLFPYYTSTVKRAPKRPLIILPHTETELTAPAYGHEVVQPGDSDLTTQHEGTPIGQRIIVSGRVLDEDGRAVPNTLIEIWQANAAGRYVHINDQHDAPLDPNFSGAGRAVTDNEGRYKFITIRPGAYSWQNHENAWRPAHIHFSLFGPSFLSRLVTQMYFPDDPLFDFDPMFTSVDPKARQRMVSRFSLFTTIPEWGLGFEWDIVLRGTNATPMEQ